MSKTTFFEHTTPIINLEWMRDVRVQPMDPVPVVPVVPVAKDFYLFCFCNAIAGDTETLRSSSVNTCLMPRLIPIHIP
jgi:hypothetical protein